MKKYFIVILLVFVTCWGSIAQDQNSLPYQNDQLSAIPVSPPSGPTHWLFQGPPAQSKLLAALRAHRLGADFRRHQGARQESTPFHPVSEPLNPFSPGLRTAL